MAEFNKEYVHAVEDNKLYGKYGYFADNIDNLRDIVNDNNMAAFWGKLSFSESTDASFPFVKVENNKHYRFFYYDASLPQESHIRNVTNRELALWLARGNGEAHYFSGVMPSNCFTEFLYHPHEGDKPVNKRVMVRKWDDTEWHELTTDYLGLDN